MKVAISSTGDTLESAVDPRFGRARWFIVFDIDTGEHEAVDNTRNLSRPQGAGVQAAGTVSRLGASHVITGHCGPKAFQALEAAGIVVQLVPGGSVLDAVNRFRNGELTPSTSPDIQGHW